MADRALEDTEETRAAVARTIEKVFILGDLSEFDQKILGDLGESEVTLTLTRIRILIENKYILSGRMLKLYVPIHSPLDALTFTSYGLTYLIFIGSLGVENLPPSTFSIVVIPTNYYLPTTHAHQSPVQSRHLYWNGHDVQLIRWLV